MKTKILTLITTTFVTAFIIGSTVQMQAQEKKKETTEAVAKEKDSNRKMPFNGKVAEIDKSAKTVKIGTRTFKVTANTEITKNGKSATLDDASIGEISGGSYQDNNGTLELVKIRFGPKPEGLENKEENKPAEKTEKGRSKKS
jgi:hypothetical protein